MCPLKRAVPIQLGVQNDTGWFCFSLADTSKLKHFVQSEPCVCGLHRGGSENFFYKGPDGDHFRLYGRSSVTAIPFCFCMQKAAGDDRSKMSVTVSQPSFSSRHWILYHFHVSLNAILHLILFSSLRKCKNRFWLMGPSETEPRLGSRAGWQGPGLKHACSSINS